MKFCFTNADGAEELQRLLDAIVERRQEAESYMSTKIVLPDNDEDPASYFIEADIDCGPDSVEHKVTLQLTSTEDFDGSDDSFAHHVLIPGWLYKKVPLSGATSWHDKTVFVDLTDYDREEIVTAMVAIITEYDS